MKKSKCIELVLITATLASCHKPSKEWTDGDTKTYIRSDTTAPYSKTRSHSSFGTTALWFYAFRPYGNYYNGNYTKAGYYSNAINQNSNIGNNNTKNNIVRGGFGTSGYSVSS